MSLKRRQLRTSVTPGDQIGRRVTPKGALVYSEVENVGKEVQFDGQQTTVGQGNVRNPKTGKYESGGPFYTTRQEVHLGLSSVGLQKVTIHPFTGDKIETIYNGPIWTPGPNSNWIGKVDLNGQSHTSPEQSQIDSDHNEMGATAISLTAPTNPAATAAVGFGEIFREGFPTLPGISSWKRRTEIAKAAGSEYLNTVFGWLPLIDEVKAVRDATKHHKAIMDSYEGGSGKNNRREFAFDPIEESFEKEIPEVTFAGPSGVFSIPSDKGTLSIRTEVRKKSWFVGAFTYTAPSSTDSWRKALGYSTEADKLYGTALTPDVLWELAPWSWAIDWFSNTGDVINNFTQFKINGLVMRYGYMMSNIDTITTYTLRDAGFLGKRYSAGPTTQVTKTKVRTPANPYGFGVGWEDLSPFQLAVTAALGITKLR